MDIEELLKQGLIKAKTRHQELESTPDSYEVVPQTKDCEDCGKLVSDRRINFQKQTLLGRRPNVPHWKIHCSVCNMYRNPLNNKFELTKGELTSLLYEQKVKKHK